jgi:hypothetical protein
MSKTPMLICCSMLFVGSPGVLLAHDIQRINPAGLTTSPTISHAVKAKPGVVIWVGGQTSQNAKQASSSITEIWLDRSAELALACVHKEYPNKIAHVLNSDADVKAPHELTPAFYGCYDWHSSVHGHWLLARVARLYGDAPFAARRERHSTRASPRRISRRRCAT